MCDDRGPPQAGHPCYRRKNPQNSHKMNGRFRRPAFREQEVFLGSFSSCRPAVQSTDEVAESVLWSQIATELQVFVAIERGELEDLGILHRPCAEFLVG